MAKRNGARLVIINREPTEFDDIADLVVRQDIGTVLEPFIVALNRDIICSQAVTLFIHCCIFVLFRWMAVLSSIRRDL